MFDYEALAADALRATPTGELDLMLGRATPAHVTSVVANGCPTGVDLAGLSAELVAQAAHGINKKIELLPLVQRYQNALRDYYNAGKHRENS